MFIRKYFACIESIFPWVFICTLTWWLDRLFVELGHRATDSAICKHNDLQYVHWHQGCTFAAVLAQTIHGIRKKRTQFYREMALLGVHLYEPCLIHIYTLQTLLCMSWCFILLCIVDVSPWLCDETILQYRATLTLLAFIVIVCSLATEHAVWNWTLQRAVRLQPDTIDV